MNKLWQKVVEFFAKIFGKQGTIPREVAEQDTNISEWWKVYQAKAPWLDYHYVVANGQKLYRKRLTLNPAKIAASELAGLVLAEAPAVSAGKLVEKIIESERFWANERRHLEYQAVLGGRAIKVYVEQGHDGKNQIRLDFVMAHNVIPLEWDNSEVVEASFLDRRVIDGKSYIRVETHKRNEQKTGYVIESKSFDEEGGKEVSLEKYWPGIEPLVDVPIDEPAFVYFKNPEANNIDPESPLGIAIFANALDTIQAQDMAFDSFITEIKLGRQRIAIPGTVMRAFNDPDDEGKRKLCFDPTDEAYVRFEGDDKDKLEIKDLSGQLRVDAYKTAIQTLLDIYAIQIGFDAGYFSFEGASVKTATEVISDNSHTFKTIQAYHDVEDFGLRHLFRIINKIGAYYKIEGATTDAPQITWDDSVIEDRNSRAKYYEDLYSQNLIDQVSALMKIHGIDEKAAAEMAEKIKSGKATITNNSLFGNEGGTQK